MGPVRIVFIVVYLAVLCCYFFAETSGIFKWRVANKCIMATMFLGYFLFEFFNKEYHTQGWYAWLCVIGFLLSWLGDVLLLFSFFKGGIAFMTGNMFFAVYLAFEYAAHEVSFSIAWLVIPLVVFPASIFYILHFLKKVDFKKIGLLMPVYVTTVTVHGMLALVLAITTKELHYILLGLGLGLFMVSDYFLTINKFIHKRNWVLRCNSATYFLGMLLAAVSFTF